MGTSSAWRIGTVLFAVASLVASLATGAPVQAATLLVPENQGPGGRALYAWDTGESWPGGEQHDPRLDEPVSCWRAGISLSDLFADMAEQAGVAIGFWPHDDENRRLRVHVFLNSDEPPTLRDLMAQLTWVTDCTFGCTGSGAGSSYYLLGTSIAEGAVANLRRRETQAREDAENRLQAIKDRRVQIEEALLLPRGEAVDLYLGEDDALLLTTLDPARRAAAQVVLRPENLPRLLDVIQFDPMLPPEVESMQAFCSNINLFPLPQEDKEAVAMVFPDYDVDYGDPKVWCPLIVDSLGRVRLGSPRYYGDTSATGLGTLVLVMDLSGDIHSRPKDEVALRRALGETITPDEEEAYVAGREEEIAAEERSARRLEAGGRWLSDEMRELLENTTLSLAAGTHPAWMIEEEVGTATGLHLIADGLLDAKADMTAAEGDGVSALAALKAFCDTPGRNFMRSPEWEWGDAGRFLAFRTANRDIWRAAMLPQALLDWIDGQVEPYLPGPDASGERAETAEFDLPVDPAGWTFWIGSLSDLQIQYGAVVPYAEPGDLLDAARRSTWGAAFALAKENPAVLRFLGSLHSAQWESAHAGTLEAPGGLSPDQMKLLGAAIEERSSWNLHLPEDSSITISISQGEAESKVLWRHVTYDAAGERGTGAAGGGGTYSEEQAGGVDWYRVHLTARGLLEGDDEEQTILEKQVPFLPISIEVHADVGS
jgi:hypothetical protein